MKKLSYSKPILLLILLQSITVILFAKDKILPYEQAPKEIQAYIAEHFPAAEVLRYEIDIEGLIKEHEIKFSDGTELTFNRRNNIIKIDSKFKLPDSVIPDEILSYVKTNYPERFITEWKIDGRKQEVELDNDIDLEFTMGGTFIRIDR